MKFKKIFQKAAAVVMAAVTVFSVLDVYKRQE